MEYYGPLLPHESQENQKPPAAGRLETFSSRVREILHSGETAKEADVEDDDEETATGKHETRTRYRRKRSIASYISNLFAGRRPESGNQEGETSDDKHEPSRRAFIPLGVELASGDDGEAVNELPEPEVTTNQPPDINAFEHEDDNQDLPTAARRNANPPLSLVLPQNQSAQSGGNISPQGPNQPGGGGNPNVVPPSAGGNVLNPPIPDIINITNIENRPGWGPALVVGGVVDQLSRRRDRRQRRETRRVDERVKELDKKHQEAVFSQQLERKEARKLADRDRFMREREARSKLAAPETKVPTTPGTLKMSFLDRISSDSLPTEQSLPNKIVETPKTIPLSPERKQEVSPAIYEHRSRIEATQLKPELTEKTSQLLLEQIEAAAEQDVPIEGQYERSHEIKDVASGSQTVSAQPTLQQAGDGHNAENYDLLTANNPAGNNSQNSNLPGMAGAQYKKAIQGGVIGGITLILLILIFLLLR